VRASCPFTNRTAHKLGKSDSPFPGDEKSKWKKGVRH